MTNTVPLMIVAYITASGGEAAIARIENFTSKGRVTVESPFFGTLEGTLESIHVPGRRYYEHVERSNVTIDDRSVHTAVDPTIFAPR
jgi:hypothetical protein